MQVNAAGQSNAGVLANRIAPNYFATMRTPLLSGRDVSWTDTNKAGRKAIVNEKGAWLLFAPSEPTGKAILFG